jgi:hypothetical protein
MPDVHTEDLEFNYERYLTQLRTSDREQWTGEQIAALNDEMLGSMEWENAQIQLQPIKDGGDTARYNEQLQLAGIEIRERHPYFGQPTPGKRARVPINEQQAEVASWTMDPNLRGVPIVDGAREYLDARDDVLTTLKLEHNLTTLDGSQKEHAVKARAYLRGIAENIAARNPEFSHMWDRLYSREVSELNDGYSDEVVDFYGDDLFEVTMGITPDTLPQFTNEFLGGAA